MAGRAIMSNSLVMFDFNSLGSFEYFNYDLLINLLFASLDEVRWMLDPNLSSPFS